MRNQYQTNTERYRRAIVRSMNDGDEAALKALSHLTRGDKTMALNTVKEYCSHYADGKVESAEDASDFELTFDVVMAELFGGGTELEWNS